MKSNFKTMELGRQALALEDALRLTNPQGAITIEVFTSTLSSLSPRAYRRKLRQIIREAQE